MPAIGTQTFGEGAKKCLKLANEEFVRKMQWGNDWNWIRIAMLYAITPNGTSTITGTRLTMGVVSNTIQGRTYNSTNTTNFAGCLINHTNESTGQDLTYNANSGFPFYQQTAVHGATLVRVGNTNNIAVFATTGSQPAMPTTTGSTTQRRGIIMADLLRNNAMGSATANWQSQIVCNNTSGGAQLDVLHEMLYMEQYFQISGSAVTGMAATNLTNFGTNPDEVNNGPLDSVSIFWNQQAFPLEIYELAVFRLR